MARRVLTLLIMLSVLTLILAGCGGDTPEEIGAEPTTEAPVEEPTEAPAAPEEPTAEPADTEEPAATDQPEDSAGPMYDQPSSSAPRISPNVDSGRHDSPATGRKRYEVDDRTDSRHDGQPTRYAGEIDVTGSTRHCAGQPLRPKRITDPEEAYTLARDADAETVWLADMSEFNNTYTLMVSRKRWIRALSASASGGGD